MGAFAELLNQAKNKSSVDFERLAVIYRDMIHNASYVNGKYDEDLNQELLLALFRSVQTFKIDEKANAGQRENHFETQQCEWKSYEKENGSSRRNLLSESGISTKGRAKRCSSRSYRAK